MKKQLYELLKENSYRQLEFQSAAVSSIEQKGGILLGAILATPTLTFSLSNMWNIYFTLGLFPLAVSCFFAIKSFWCRDFLLPAEVKNFYIENNHLHDKDVYIHFIDDCSRSVEENATLLKIKGKNFNKALVCFCIALFSFVMSMSEGRWFAMSTNTVSNQFNLLRSEQSVRTATSQQRSSNRDSSGIIPDRKPTTLNITKGITPEKK